MDREKQIDEMAMLMSEGARPAIEDAIILYEKGYRKQSEVVREIFEEIESLLYKYTYQDVHKDFVISIGVTYELDELKKKYTEEQK